MRIFYFLALLCLAALGARADSTFQIPLLFTGGHQTEQGDHGRPVILIAAALNVPPAVFREAFTHVHPASAGQNPSRNQVQANKHELMKRLAAYGVTNELLDQVSNHYRYQRAAGEMWTYRDAQGYATLQDGKILSVTIVDPGTGYTSVPDVSLSGQPDQHLTATIHFDRDMLKNGSIATVTSTPQG